MWPSLPRKSPGRSELNGIHEAYHVDDYDTPARCDSRACVLSLSAIGVAPEIVQNFGPDLSASARDEKPRLGFFLFVIKMLHSTSTRGREEARRLLRPSRSSEGSRQSVRDWRERLLKRASRRDDRRANNRTHSLSRLHRLSWPTTVSCKQARALY